MSEGYERRPEERMANQWRGVAYFGLVCLFVVSSSASIECMRLESENAALRTQLDYWTCDKQFEPIPIPEPQSAESPTLIDDRDQYEKDAESGEVYPIIRNQ